MIGSALTIAFLAIFAVVYWLVTSIMEIDKTSAIVESASQSEALEHLKNTCPIRSLARDDRKSGRGGEKG